MPDAAFAGALDHDARKQVAGVRVWRGQAALVARMPRSSNERRAEHTYHLKPPRRAYDVSISREGSMSFTQVPG